MKLPNIYATPYYKYYILISIAIAVLAVMALPGLKYGIDLQGGTQLLATLNEAVPEQDISLHLDKYNLEDLTIKFTENPLTGRKGLIIEFTGTPDLIEAELVADSQPERAIALASPFVTSNITGITDARGIVELAKAEFTKTIQSDLSAFLGIPEENISSVEIGASLGQEFWESSQRALFVAFFLIAAIVFILFREPVPAIAVIQAAVYDVLIALAGMAVFHIPLTLPTIAALLMILGHSVDTDILTTDRVLKRREGTAAERAYGAMITGVTMTGTILIVLFVLVTFSYFNQMNTLFQIGAVLMFGLLGDLPSSWCTNTVMITWWAERKQK